MTKGYLVKLNGVEYALPLMKINDTDSIAVFDMLSDCKMARDAVKATYDLIQKQNYPKIDTVISAETKGIVLAERLSDLLDADMVILRKTQKLYHPEVIKGKVETFTTKGEHYLHLDVKQSPKLEHKNVLIVDDVVSTGSSLKAIEDILSQVHANVVGKAFVFAEGDSADRKDICYVEKLPIIKD